MSTGTSGNWTSGRHLSSLVTSASRIMILVCLMEAASLTMAVMGRRRAKEGRGRHYRVRTCAARHPLALLAVVFEWRGRAAIGERGERSVRVRRHRARRKWSHRRIWHRSWWWHASHPCPRRRIHARHHARRIPLKIWNWAHMSWYRFTLWDVPLLFVSVDRVLGRLGFYSNAKGRANVDFLAFSLINEHPLRPPSLGWSPRTRLS